MRKVTLGSISLLLIIIFTSFKQNNLIITVSPKVAAIGQRIKVKVENSTAKNLKNLKVILRDYDDEKIELPIITQNKSGTQEYEVEIPKFFNIKDKIFLSGGPKIIEVQDGDTKSNSFHLEVQRDVDLDNFFVIQSIFSPKLTDLIEQGLVVNYINNSKITDFEPKLDPDFDLVKSISDETVCDKLTIYEPSSGIFASLPPNSKEEYDEVSITSYNPCQADAIQPRFGISKPIAQSQNDGSGVTIAIIDSGVNISEFPNNSIEMITTDLGESDDDNHGTRVAHIAQTSAPGAKIISIKVCTGKKCRADRVVKGICKALDMPLKDKNKLIINLSLGGDTNFIPMLEVIQLAIRQGVKVVVAAGNRVHDHEEKDGQFKKQIPHYPADYANPKLSKFSGKEAINQIPGMIVVGAVVKSGDKWERSKYSNTGSVDLVEEIPDSKSDSNAAGGTSFTTPVISGLLARWLQNCNLTPLELKDKVKAKVFPYPYFYIRTLNENLSFKEEFGAGKPLEDYSKINC